MKKIEETKLDSHINGFRIKTHTKEKLTYWRRQQNRSEPNFLQNMLDNLPEIPETLQDQPQHETSYVPTSDDKT
jgi:hypothetical protein